MKTFAAVLGAGLLLAGCTGGGGDEPGPQAAAEPVEQAGEDAASGDAPDPEAVCEGFWGGEDPLGERVPELLIGIGDQLGDPEPYRWVDFHLGNLIDQAPPEMVEPLEVIRAPFAEISRVVDEGGGSLSMDTSGVEGAAHELMSLCADAGWTYS